MNFLFWNRFEGMYVFVSPTPFPEKNALFYLLYWIAENSRWTNHLVYSLTNIFDCVISLILNKSPTTWEYCKLPVKYQMLQHIMYLLSFQCLVFLLKCSKYKDMHQQSLQMSLTSIPWFIYVLSPNSKKHHWIEKTVLI